DLALQRAAGLEGERSAAVEVEDAHRIEPFQASDRRRAPLESGDQEAIVAIKGRGAAFVTTGVVICACGQSGGSGQTDRDGHDEHAAHPTCPLSESKRAHVSSSTPASRPGTRAPRRWVKRCA